MANTQGAAAPAQNQQNVVQEIGYVGARLREKSTYGGLAMAVGLALPLLTKLDPSLSGTSVDTIVTGLSYLGMGVGIFIGIFLPEKGSKAVIAFLIASAAALSFMPQSAHALVRHRHVAAIPMPQARPDAIPANATLDAGKAAAEPSATTVAQNVLSTAPADINYAIQLASAANTPQSGVRKQCYQAILAAIPTPPTGTTVPPGPDVVTHIEQAAELADTLNPSSPVFVNCAGAAALAGQSVLSFVNAVVTGIAGISVLAPKIP